MSRKATVSPWALLMMAAAPLPIAALNAQTVYWLHSPLALDCYILSLLALAGRGLVASARAEIAVLVLGCIAALTVPFVLLAQGADLAAGAGVWVLLLGTLFLIWRALSLLAEEKGLLRWAGPALFGLVLVMAWEILVRGFAVPAVLLPAPSAILAAMPHHAPELWDDFSQTVLKSVVRGYLIGCGAGFAVAILADRFPFLARGLLPLGNLASAIPVVGIAPVMVMWFGFDWQSKAAVIVIMTFFPMLINTLAGLGSAEKIQLDLMRSYGAGYGRTLLLLRLPCALPFIFNGLKINSTLALIGAIVAEFFGTPVVGMGFRISTEVARMNLDVVWATIAVAAVTGSALYGGLSVIERRATAWHPSFRKK